MFQFGTGGMIVITRRGKRSEPHRVSEVFRIVPTAYVPQKAREAPRTGFDGRGRVSAMGFREGGPTPSYLRSLNIWTVNRCSYESKEVWMARQTNPTPLRMTAAGRP